MFIVTEYAALKSLSNEQKSMFKSWGLHAEAEHFLYFNNSRI